MSDENDLQRKIRRQMGSEFRSNPRKAFEQHGLTASLHRGGMRTVVAAGLIVVGVLIWTAVRH
jgi:hypothetical protein